MNKFVLMCLLVVSGINAQGRFYPSLNSLITLKERSTFPSSLNYIEDWYIATSNQLFYSDLQQSSSSKSDTSFRRLGIIARNKNKFEFYNTGFAISFNENFEKKDRPIFLANNNKFPVVAYTSSFSLKSFDPEENMQLFFILKLISNNSDEQTLANMINTFSKPKSNETNIGRFILDINAKNKIKIDKNKFENTDNTLKELCSDINKQLPKFNCVYSAYKTYIESKNKTTTKNNMSLFFRSVFPTDIEDIINENILPSGNFEFIDKSVRISLPNEYFKYSSQMQENEKVSFLVRELKYDLNYSYKYGGYVFSIKLFPQEKNDIKDNFEFNYRFISVFTKKYEVKQVKLSGKDLNFIEIFFYNDFLEVFIETNNDSIVYPQRYELFEKIKFSLK